MRSLFFVENPHSPTHPMRRRTELLVLATFLVAGCSSWHSRSAPSPADSLGFGHPVRVVRTDGSAIVLDPALVRGDSIVGTSGSTRVAIALRDVQRVDERRTSVLRTGALVVLGAFVAVIALAAATLTPNWN